MSNFQTELKTVKARKEHDCDCYQRVMESGYTLNDFDEKYHDELNRLACNSGKIEIGEEHFEWSGCFDGEMFTAKANKAMYDLVCEMEWFDN